MMLGASLDFKRGFFSVLNSLGRLCIRPMIISLAVNVGSSASVLRCKNACEACVFAQLFTSNVVDESPFEFSNFCGKSLSTVNVRSVSSLTQR